MNNHTMKKPSYSAPETIYQDLLLDFTLCETSNITGGLDDMPEDVLDIDF